MNPFDLRWLWRAIRGRSITFALVFVLALVGLSATRAIRNLLDGLPLPWLIAWIAPLILLALLAKLEPRILPDESIRARIAFVLIIAGLVFAVAIPRLLPEEKPSPDETPEADTPHRPQRPGPPSRR